MKKICAFGFVLIVSFFAFAGDAAFFVDNGFSADGSVYIFSQYGQTDKTFRGWAEIYTIDVKTNKYVSGGVFATQPSSATASKQGKEIYTKLVDANYGEVKKYGNNPSSPEQVLFINGDESRPATDEIVFKDFGVAPLDSQATYHVQLVPTVKGNGANVSSSFYIMLEKHDVNGRVLGRQKIGSPDIVRKGVSGYKIQKIFCDRAGKNIVLVVEKYLNDNPGVSVRYMVEAAVLNSELSFSATPHLD